MQFALNFSENFQILFPSGQFKKNHEKKLKKKKQKQKRKLSVKILARLWLMWIFLGFHFF